LKSNVFFTGLNYFFKKTVNGLVLFNKYHWWN